MKRCANPRHYRKHELVLSMLSLLDNTESIEYEFKLNKTIDKMRLQPQRYYDVTESFHSNTITPSLLPSTTPTMFVSYWVLSTAWTKTHELSGWKDSLTAFGNDSLENWTAESATKNTKENPLIRPPRRSENVEASRKDIVVDEPRVNRKHAHQQDDVPTTEERVKNLKRENNWIMCGVTDQYYAR